MASPDTQQRLAVLSRQIDHREQARAGLALRASHARAEQRLRRLRAVLDHLDRSLATLKEERRRLLTELLNRHARFDE